MENFNEKFQIALNLFKSKEYYKAGQLCKKLILKYPQIPILYNILGIIFTEEGKINKAILCFERGIKIDPTFAMFYNNLGNIYKQQVKKIYDNPKINNLQKKELAFALGKASEDVNDFPKAFTYFRKANELHRREFTYSIKSEKEEFLNIKKVFTKKFIDKFSNYGFSDSTPIFILGMPRSGTTLVEQILSSHPKVFAGDELNFLPKIIKKFFYGDKMNLINKNFLSLDNKIIESIGKEYINNLKNISAISERITDKLPINFKWIGLIKLILPNAKIIHCNRNSKDNCLSIYKNFFTSNEMNYSYHLDDIVEFYNLYDDLMKYWNNVIPNFVYNIKYEEIIENPDKQISKLLKNCNLNIVDSCFHFYKNRRVIKTASDVQARKKIYNTSINSWKNYKKELFNSFKKLSN